MRQISWLALVALIVLVAGLAAYVLWDYLDQPRQGAQPGDERDRQVAAPNHQRPPKRDAAGRHPNHGSLAKPSQATRDKQAKQKQGKQKQGKQKQRKQNKQPALQGAGAPIPASAFGPAPGAHRTQPVSPPNNPAPPVQSDGFDPRPPGRPAGTGGVGHAYEHVAPPTIYDHDQHDRIVDQPERPTRPPDQPPPPEQSSAPVGAREDRPGPVLMGEIVSPFVPTGLVRVRGVVFEGELGPGVEAPLIGSAVEVSETGDRFIVLQTMKER